MDNTLNKIYHRFLAKMPIFDKNGANIDFNCGHEKSLNEF